MGLLRLTWVTPFTAISTNLILESPKYRQECEPSFRLGVQRAFLVLLVLAALPVRAAEPIPLQVIPYQVRKQEIPVLPFLVPPPPLLLEPAKPKKRRRNSGRDQDGEDDFDWLMD